MALSFPGLFSLYLKQKKAYDQMIHSGIEVVMRLP